MTASIGQSVVKKAVVGVMALGLAGGFLGSQEAQAHRRDFPFTYDWKQPSKGEKEIELKSRYRGRNDSFRQELEFEYGITDRWMIAPYLEFEKEAGGSLEYTAWKLESRYQFGKFKTGKILPGVYLEYINPKDEKDEVEAKLILSRYDRHGGDLSLNLIAERSLEDGSKWEKEYSFGYARPIGKNRYDTRAGFEWIHYLEDKYINAGPVFGFAPTGNTWVVAGYAFPIKGRNDGNRGEFRLIAEYEWF
jgi:hypothetical protein